MDNQMMDMVNCSGVYIIVNIMDYRAYVGQAKRFSKRSHVAELEQGIDNSQLQADYDDREKDRDLIYFIVVYGDEILGQDILDKYERLYMTLMEEMGFCLYNTNIQKSDRTIEKLGMDETERARAEKALREDFMIRFNNSLENLKADKGEIRRQALEYYIS